MRWPGPELHRRKEFGDQLLLLWQTDELLRSISSAPLGGGIQITEWVINAQVPPSYERTDPDAHLRDLAVGLGLQEPGVGMLTAAQVSGFCTHEEDGVRVDATVGLRVPTWAAAPKSADEVPGGAPLIGTINVIAFVPERLSEAALVNAVLTVTEAKTQALLEAGAPGTGTASDAVVVLCPDDGPLEKFGGPRSHWGARLARCVHSAVLQGAQSGSST
jgi:adenosylcobinamide hydrolase